MEGRKSTRSIEQKNISNFRHWDRLQRKYSIRVKRFNVIIEELKLRITAIGGDRPVIEESKKFWGNIWTQSDHKKDAK